MLARPIAALPAEDPRAVTAYEPKFDGWRLLVFRGPGEGVQLQSRSGRLLTGYFPEVARIARDHLPPGVVLDGEVIVWEGERRRLSFAHLQRRITASPRRALERALQQRC
jgi:ATP-dependent DNA ligase